MTRRAPLFLPVNWRNALAYYAQGLVAPGGTLARCHKDFLELVPRRLPLLIDKVSGSVAEACATAAGDFPVILEIDDDVLVSGTALDAGGTPAAIAPAGMIPTGHVSQVHVRSGKDRDEFRARRYRNVDTSRLPVVVTESLFQGGGVSAEVLSAWLRDLPDTEIAGREDLIGRQCVAGALMLLLASLPPEAVILEGTGRLVEKVLSRSGSAGIVNLLPDALAEIGWIDGEDDRSVCTAALEVLVQMSGSDPLVTSEVLSEMRRLLASRHLSDANLVRAYLDRILAIDRGDVEFTSFRQGGGLRSAKGLLLFLLRPAPVAAKSWLTEDINAEHEIVAMAAIFAGIAHRSTGLPSEFRGSDVLQHLLYDWIASGVNGGDIILSHELDPKIILEQNATSLMLTISDEADSALTKNEEESNDH